MMDVFANFSSPNVSQETLFHNNDMSKNTLVVDIDKWIPLNENWPISLA